MDEDRLTLEELVVGLTGPWAEADGRTLKLLLRIIQSGRLDIPRLQKLARRERAEIALHWLMTLTPESERSAGVDELAAALGGTPRGFRGVRYDYRPSRLEGRPATAEQLWRTKRS